MEPEQFSRIVWACRRGMLELDVLLGNFLKEVFVSLPINEKNIFIQILNENDQDLFNWLMKKEEPTNPHFLLIIKKIRHHADYRHSA